jgi:hypothetical protein
MFYISFETGDLIKILASDPSGWLYGYKMTEDTLVDISKAKLGYFPGNYIKALESQDPDSKINYSDKFEGLDIDQSTELDQLDNIPTSYLDYAKKIYADPE